MPKDGRTDRYAEANSRFYNFANAPRNWRERERGERERERERQPVNYWSGKFSETLMCIMQVTFY